MNLHVENKQLFVGDVRIIGVAISSIFLIGDTEVISLSSMFDTPPESIIISPFVPLPSEE
ncbi:MULTISPECIES: spore gernimation protein GerPD [unclassified Paenibacillus]|uniref:spore gernimation protein GerPD n=1 Tax=unclassified Paenibacillus TaxID=185978 RepID=UPI00277D2BAD|nr:MULTISPECIES: spore gernimation protein GerPD [unclassified Paenibacillus]MDQ0902549.1 spore germination protein PD [Paenibacillus sp. V4I7]MDQ0918941.1 spore germination protein PD [Paenibacillus sp. V4I5]